MNKESNQQNHQQSSSQVSQSTIVKFLDNQSKELELKNQELTIRKAEIDHNKDYALKALDAQKEDRRETREMYQSVMKLKTVIYCVCFIAIMIFSCFAIFMGESQVIMEVIKIAIPALATGVGGFYFGRNKGIESMKNSD